MEGFEIKERTTPHYQKDFIKTIAICAFFGFFGIHRLYTGYKRIGFFQMFTLGGCFIWWFIDILSMCFNRYKDKYGNPLDDYNAGVASLVLTAIAIVLLALGIMGAPYLLDI